MNARVSLETEIVLPPLKRQALLPRAEFRPPIKRHYLPIFGLGFALFAVAAILSLFLQWRAMTITELQVQSRVSVLEYKVELANDVADKQMERISALNLETAGLALRLDDAEQQASNERSRIATLDAETADLTRRDQSLEQTVRPRRLSTAQMSDIVAAWKGRSGNSVTLWSYDLDVEGRALAEQIRECLTGAHVVVVNNIGRLDSDSPLRIGIHIAGADKRLVDAIYNGLHKIGGLDITQIAVSTGDTEAAAPTEIFVGMKPLPPQK